MSLISSLFVTFCNCLPWLAVGTFAALSVRGQKSSATLMLQAAGAAALFLLPLGQWLIVRLLLQTLIKAEVSLVHAANIIFGFLLFVSLVAFAAGYCFERLTRRKPAPVSATPA
jgi:hypothetical protein